MDETPLTVTLRPYNKQTDEAFVVSTWRSSIYYDKEENKNSPVTMESKIIFRKLSMAIKKILENAKVQIACLKETPTLIIGYSVVTEDHLDWVYVKVDYRNQGIGALLVPKDVKTVTSDLTKIGKAIKEKKKLETKGETNGREENREVRQV